MSRTWSCIAL